MIMSIWSMDKNKVPKYTYPHVQISQIQSSFLFFPVPIFPQQSRIE